ncbi:conserved protein of unknown function [Streptomyces sp. KY75]|nr:conserved protein of unknown function [Streptomyces sp. KY75]
MTLAAAASDRRMPSLTVVVSSDTDICFSPGLYGLLADGSTAFAADSFRAKRLSVPFHARTPGRPGDASHRRYRHRQSDTKEL